MNWMDVCVIIIIAISALKGLSIGLVLSLFNIASYIVAGIIAKIYYSYLSIFIIENTNWFFKIQDFIFKNMKFLAQNNMQAAVSEEKNVFEIMNLPKTLENLIIKSDAFTQYNEGALYNINIYISEIVAKFILDLLSIIIIFMIAKIALNILGKILDGVASLPIINQFNKLGGLIFGALKGVIIVFILAAVMIPVTSIFPNSSLVNALQASSLAKSFYDYNILLYMLKSIVGYGSNQLVSGF